MPYCGILLLGNKNRGQCFALSAAAGKEAACTRYHARIFLGNIKGHEEGGFTNENGSPFSNRCFADGAMHRYEK